MIISLHVCKKNCKLEQKERRYEADGAVRREAVCFSINKIKSGGFSMEVFSVSQQVAISREDGEQYKAVHSEHTAREETSSSIRHSYTVLDGNILLREKQRQPESLLFPR